MNNLNYILKYLLYLILLKGSIVIYAQNTDHGGADWTPGSGTVSGRHYNIGTFIVPAGVTLTVDASVHYFRVEAANITVAGTINANNAGESGGSGGAGGQFAYGDGSGCDGGHGGLAGGNGIGSGGGNRGANGNQGDCSDMDCGVLCIGGADGYNAGGSGAGGGAGGSYGGRGGNGGLSAQGQGYTSPSLSGGAYVSGGSATSIYGTNCASDITWGSGGAGAGGGGGGYASGTSGGAGGRGGGMVALFATGSLTISGNILCNGANGGSGGNGAGQSIDNDWDCTLNIGGFWQGSQDGYNNDCFVCTYYNYDASGGAGGGAGGGSGGGILLQSSGSMNITGSLQVNGGTGGTAGLPSPNNGQCNDWAQGGGGGGGGRIKIFRNPCIYNVINPTSSFAGGGGGGGYVAGFSGNTGTVCIDYEPTYLPLSGGTISLSNPAFCVSGNVPLISATVASGGIAGNYLYQWQYSVTGTGGPWYDILGANQNTYDPGVITQTTWYRRQVTSLNCIEYSNIVVATVNALPNVTLTDIYPPQCTSTTSFTLTGGTPSGGTYSGPGVTGANFNPSAAGPGIHTITYTYTDANGCTGSNTIPIIVGANPIGIISGLSPVCGYSQEDYSNTGNTFMVTNWTVTGGNIVSGQGTENIRIQWDNGPTGNISFTGQDGLGCSSLNAADLNIVINPVPVITFTTLDSLCLNTPPFILTNASPAGGSYSGTGVTGNAFNPAAAGAGVHTIYYTYTDGYSCTNTDSTLIMVNDIPSLSFPILNDVCGSEPPFPLNTATPPGGIYSGPGVHSGIFNPAVAGTGTHSITYTYTSPSTGCTNTVASSITVHEVPVADAGRDTMICYGTDVNLVASGADPGGSYLWDDGTGNPVRLVSGLTAGTTFTVTVTNSSGCFSVDAVSVFVNPQMDISLTATHATCYGFSNGSVLAHVSGGYFPYTYSWNNGQTANPAVNLTAGFYSVTATDASYIHCHITDTITVTQPDSALLVNVDSTLVSCNGLSDGSITITTAGGTPPYIFLWNNGSNSSVLTGLSAGIYTVTVTDAQQCRVVKPVNITQPNPLMVFFDSLVISCNGANDGRITAVVTGGTLPYSYLWNTGETSQSIVDLIPGNYTVTVTDGNLCTASHFLSLTEPAPLQLSINPQDVSCYGLSDGTAGAVVTGGTLPYNYYWSDNQTTPTAVGLVAGVYSVTVLDAHQCVIMGSVDILQPPLLTVMVDSVNVLCNGGSTGRIDLTPQGGTPPYNFSWDNGSSTEDISGLAAGNYTVNVTDQHACRIIRSIQITEPLPLVVDLEVTDEVCLNDCNGFVTADVSGGTSPYEYLWNTDPPQMNAVTGSLCTGDYAVTVTDFNQCVQYASAAVSTHTLLQASFIATPPEGNVPIEIGFTYTGQTASSWSWSFGDGGTSNDVNPSHYYRIDSVYDVQLIVNSGYPDYCTDTYVSQVIVYPNSTLFVPNAFTPNGDHVNDRFEVKGYAIKKIDVFIYNRWGELVTEFHTLDGYWDGYVDGKLAPAGTYVYQIRAKGYDDNVFRKIGKFTLVLK